MNIKRKTQIVSALLITYTFLFQSCATIIKGTSQGIPVTSNPIGEVLAVLGLIIGWGGSIFIDFLTGANYKLSPQELNLTLTQIEGKAQPNYVFIDSEKFQSVKWIRIDFGNSDEK